MTVAVRYATGSDQDRKDLRGLITSKLGGERIQIVDVPASGTPTVTLQIDVIEARSVDFRTEGYAFHARLELAQDVILTLPDGKLLVVNATTWRTWRHGVGGRFAAVEILVQGVREMLDEFAADYRRAN